MLLRTAALALMVVLAACSAPAVSQSAAGPSVADSGTPSAAAPSASASALGIFPREGEEFFPGTYTALFQPPLTLVIGEAVDLDCAPGYRCRAEVNVNVAGWLALDFGHDHGAELNLFRLDEVYDPTSPGSLTDPPDDLASTIAALPGITVVGGLEATTVGGRAATAFTVQTGDQGVPIGTNPDVEAGLGGKVLCIVVNVDGQWVVISMGTDPDNITQNFDAAVDALRPMVDSIEWQ